MLSGNCNEHEVGFINHVSTVLQCIEICDHNYACAGFSFNNGTGGTGCIMRSQVCDEPFQDIQNSGREVWTFWVKPQDRKIKGIFLYRIFSQFKILISFSQNVEKCTFSKSPLNYAVFLKHVYLFLQKRMTFDVEVLDFGTRILFFAYNSA